MSDLISRSALLQEFEKEVERKNGYPLFHFTGIKAFIENQPKLDADTNVGSKWIPCSIDLPKKKDKKAKYGRGEYNGTVVNQDGHIFTTSVIFDYINKKWVEEVEGWKIIAWCELPEPYKGEGADNE